jgi:hypothetical protein
MVKTSKNIRGIMVALLLVSMSMAGSVSKTGTTASKFLSMGIGARAIGMGSAYVSVGTDATAMYWNPAGIADARSNQAIFSQTNWLLDIKLNYIGLVLNLGSVGNLGINMTALSMSDMEVTTANNPEGTGDTFAAGMYAFGVTYARHLTQNFIIGANLKYVREDISNSSAQGLALDIGTMFMTPFYGVRFSSSITNFGTKMQMAGDDLIIQHDPNPNSFGDNANLNAYYATDSYDMPLRLQIGLAKDFNFSGQRLTLAVDAAHPNDNTEYVNLGGELALFDEMIFIRGGFKTLFMRDREEGLTLGAGYRTPKVGDFDLSIDYAFQNMEHLGDIHTFGFILSF